MKEMILNKVPEIQAVKYEEYEYMVSYDEVKVLFNDASESNNHLMAVEKNDQILMFSLDGAAPKETLINNSFITYPESFPNVDLQYEVLEDKVKETLIIKSKEAKHSFNFSTLDDNIAYSVQEDGSIIYADIDDITDTSWKIEAPYAYDANNNKLNTNMTNNLNSYSLEVITDENTVYPIYLDPTLTGFEYSQIFALYMKNWTTANKTQKFTYDFDLLKFDASSITMHTTSQTSGKSYAQYKVYSVTEAGVATLLRTFSNSTTKYAITIPTTAVKLRIVTDLVHGYGILPIDDKLYMDAFTTRTTNFAVTGNSSYENIVGLYNSSSSLVINNIRLLMQYPINISGLGHDLNFPPDYSNLVYIKGGTSYTGWVEGTYYTGWTDIIELDANNLMSKEMTAGGMIGYRLCRRSSMPDRMLAVTSNQPVIHLMYYAYVAPTSIPTTITCDTTKQNTVSTSITSDTVKSTCIEVLNTSDTSIQIVDTAIQLIDTAKDIIASASTVVDTIRQSNISIVTINDLKRQLAINSISQSNTIRETITNTSTTSNTIRTITTSYLLSIDTNKTTNIPTDIFIDTNKITNVPCIVTSDTFKVTNVIQQVLYDTFINKHYDINSTVDTQRLIAKSTDITSDTSRPLLLDISNNLDTYRTTNRSETLAMSTMRAVIASCPIYSDTKKITSIPTEFISDTSRRTFLPITINLSLDTERDITFRKKINYPISSNWTNEYFFMVGNGGVLSANSTAVFDPIRAGFNIVGLNHRPELSDGSTLKIEYSNNQTLNYSPANDFVDNDIFFAGQFTGGKYSVTTTNPSSGRTKTVTDRVKSFYVDKQVSYYRTDTPISYGLTTDKLYISIDKVTINHHGNAATGVNGSFPMLFEYLTKISLFNRKTGTFVKEVNLPCRFDSDIYSWKPYNRPLAFSEQILALVKTSVKIPTTIAVDTNRVVNNYLNEAVIVSCNTKRVITCTESILSDTLKKNSTSINLMSNVSRNVSMSNDILVNTNREVSSEAIISLDTNREALKSILSQSNSRRSISSNEISLHDTIRKTREFISQDISLDTNRSIIVNIATTTDIDFNVSNTFRDSAKQFVGSFVFSKLKFRITKMKFTVEGSDPNVVVTVAGKNYGPTRVNGRYPVYEYVTPIDALNIDMKVLVPMSPTGAIKTGTLRIVEIETDKTVVYAKESSNIAAFNLNYESIVKKGGFRVSESASGNMRTIASLTNIYTGYPEVSRTLPIQLSKNEQFKVKADYSDDFPTCAVVLVETLTPTIITVDTDRQVRDNGTMFPVTIKSNASRSISKSININSDTNKEVSSTVTVDSDTDKKIIKNMSISSDFNRKISLSESIISDTARLKGIGVLLTASTTRSISTRTNGYVDLRRKVIKDMSLIRDTIRPIRSSEAIVLDTKRETIKVMEVDITSDTTRTVYFNLVANFKHDLKRRVVRSHPILLDTFKISAIKSIYIVDTVRDSYATNMTTVDTKRKVIKDINTLIADTKVMITSSNDFVLDTNRINAYRLAINLDTSRKIQNNISIILADTRRAVFMPMSLLSQTLDIDFESNINALLYMKEEYRNFLNFEVRQDKPEQLNITTSIVD